MPNVITIISYYIIMSLLSLSTGCTVCTNGKADLRSNILDTYHSHRNDRDHLYIHEKRKRREGKMKISKRECTREYKLQKETSRVGRANGGRKYDGGAGDDSVDDDAGGGHARVTRESCVEARDRFLAIP